MSWLRNGVVLSVCLLLQWIVGGTLHAQPALLPATQAFALNVRALQDHQLQLSWQMPKGYYLYQHKVQLKQGTQPVPLSFPAAQIHHDEFFGATKVYFDHLKLQLKVQANQTYQLTWQGCAQDRLCYPPQQMTFATDANGLLLNDSANNLENNSENNPENNLGNNPENAGNRSKTLFKPSQTQPLLSGAVLSPENADSVDGTDASTAANIVSNTVANRTLNDNASSRSATLAPALAQDQAFSAQLKQQAWGYTVLLFLGLGLLLAFSPCSLPMLPILSSLLVREHKGLKAWSIALVFVLSMAAVYAVLGLLASSAGLNFQRWLQQPITLIAFAGLFVVFAANLFGLFELRLPQALTHRLDQIQSLQRGGTLFGAAVMGMISALLVGPCMTAPLAGVLLFIAQTQNQLQGAVLLFSLGFGMGLPLLIAATLGAKVLPKAGDWMHQVKVIFGFLMLGLALYFIRPLLSIVVMQALSAVLLCIFVGYALYRVVKYPKQLRGLYLLLLVVIVPLGGYYQLQLWQDQQRQATGSFNRWQVATTAAQYRALLASAPPNRAVVVDVYADWCVACQPIEHRILKQVDVQQALGEFYLIKLDLSQYHPSHQALLNELNVLGPPTYLFLTSDHREQRQLRLTGAFQAQQLLQQLSRLTAASRQ